MEDDAALAEMLEDLEDIRDARKMLGELKRDELVDFRDYVKARKATPSETSTFLSPMFLKRFQSSFPLRSRRTTR